MDFVQDPNISKDDLNQIVDYLKENFCNLQLKSYYCLLIFAIFITVTKENNESDFWKILNVIDKLPDEHKPNISMFGKFYADLYLREKPINKDQQKPIFDELTEEEG